MFIVVPKKIKLYRFISVAVWYHLIQYMGVYEREKRMTKPGGSGTTSFSITQGIQM